MKLVFKKEEDDAIVKIEQDDEEKDFNYVELIRFLYENNELENAEFDGEFSSKEKDAINEMIAKLNKIPSEKITEEE